MAMTSLKGRLLLRDPLQNKDLAFTQEERDQFQLHGLLPAHEVGLEAQCARAYKQLYNKDSDLENTSFCAIFKTPMKCYFTRLSPIISKK